MLLPEAQRAAWKSPAYSHFKPPEIIEVDGEIKYKFICKRRYVSPNPYRHVILMHTALSSPSASPLIRARGDDTTSNLVRHVQKCDKNSTPKAGQNVITEYAHGSIYTKGKMPYKLGIWVVRRHRPFAIIQDPELLDIFCMLNSSVEVPHPTTISHDVQEMFAVTQEAVGAHLKVCAVSQSYNSMLM